jgi:acyl dehydratase
VSARWQDAAVGDELPPLEKAAVERMQLVKYAGASGDFNRIHVEEGFAREAGYPSVFAHGMLIMGFLGQCVSDWCGPAAVRSLGCRFKAITWPGDVITCRGRVTARHADGGLELSLSATNQAGVVVADGTAQVRAAS